MNGRDNGMTKAAANGIEYRFITPDDPLFDQARALRWEILRKPLGIPYSADLDDFEPGKEHLIAVEDGRVVGYGAVIIRPDGAQLRYMAVEEQMQGHGVGKGMALALLDRALHSGAEPIWLNARFTALEFWRKLGFMDVGGLFNTEETGLPHKRLEYRE